MLRLSVWVRVLLIFMSILIIDFYKLFHDRGYESVQIFYISQALLSDHKINSTFSSINWQPIRLHVFGLCMYDLARIYIMPRVIQGTGMFIIIVIFLMILFCGFCSMVWLFLCANLAYWWLPTYRLGFYLGVCHQPCHWVACRNI